MNKKIIIGAITTIVGGITIYMACKLLTKNQKRAMRRRADKLRSLNPGRTYSYEYTL